MKPPASRSAQLSTTYVDLFLIPRRNPCKWTGKSSVTDLSQSCLFCRESKGESNGTIRWLLRPSFHNLRPIKDLPLTGIAFFPITKICLFEQINRQMGLIASPRRGLQHFPLHHVPISKFPQPTARQRSDPLMGLQHWGWKITIVEIDELAT